jgi:pilus assembly protein CpaE
MYNLKIHLIGCDEQVVSAECREILGKWAILDEEFPHPWAMFKSVLNVEGETRLLVVHIRSAEDLPALRRTISTYPKYSILVVLDVHNDPTLVVKCMRAGAAQVVHAPVVVDDLREALECIDGRQGELAKLANVTMVTGAVGGCGTTTVALNLAYELARRDAQRGILMELALRKGMLAYYLNIEPRYTTTSLAADIARIDSFILEGALTSVDDNFGVLVGPYETIETEAIALDSVMRLVQLTRHLAASLVLDVPSTYDEVFFRTLADADRVVLVADQSVAAIRGAQMICHALDQTKPLVIINRYDTKLASLSVDRIQKALPDCELFTLASHPAFMAAANSGQVLRVSEPRCPVLDDFERLLQRLAPSGGEAPLPEKKSGDSIITRLGRALSLSERSN